MLSLFCQAPAVSRVFSHLSALEGSLYIFARLCTSGWSPSPWRRELVVPALIPPYCLVWQSTLGIGKHLTFDWLQSSAYMVIHLGFSAWFLASAHTLSMTLTPLPFLLSIHTSRPNSSISFSEKILSTGSFLFLDSDHTAQHNIQLSPVASWFLDLFLQLSALRRNAFVWNVFHWLIQQIYVFCYPQLANQ